MISRKKLRVGNVVSLQIDETDVTGMITEICFIREVFTIIGTRGLKDYCTETLLDQDLHVISSLG